MKNKKQKKIRIIIIIFILIFLLFPIERHLWDGGTIEYKGSFIYKVTKLHRINSDIEELNNGYLYINGTIVEILGIKVYDDSKPVKETVNSDCPKNALEIEANMIKYLNDDKELLEDYYEYSYINKLNNKVVIGLNDISGDKTITFIHTALADFYNLACVRQIESTLVEFKKINDTIDGRIVFSNSNFIFIISKSDSVEIKKGEIITINKSKCENILNEFYSIGTNVKIKFNSGENSIEFVKQ